MLQMNSVCINSFLGTDYEQNHKPIYEKGLYNFQIYSNKIVASWIFTSKFMFNSLNDNICGTALEAYILRLQGVIPLLIKSYVTCEDKYSTEKYTFVNVKDVP